MWWPSLFSRAIYSNSTSKKHKSQGIFRSHKFGTLFDMISLIFVSPTFQMYDKFCFEWKLQRVCRTPDPQTGYQKSCIRGLMSIGGFEENRFLLSQIVKIRFLEALLRRRRIGAGGFTQMTVGGTRKRKLEGKTILHSTVTYLRQGGISLEYACKVQHRIIQRK